MFVSESTLNFMGVKLQLISTEGYSWDAAFDASATIDSIKRHAIQYFYPAETSVNPDQFRVIYPAESRTLTDHHALHEEKLKDNEVLLFIRRRGAIPSSTTTPTTKAGTSGGQRNRDSPTDAELKSPTAAEILAATKDLPVPPSPQQQSNGGHHHHAHPTPFHEDSLEANVDFQLELRKIIISLVAVMATLLHGNQDADLICREMYNRIKHRLKNSEKPIEGTTFQYPPAPEVVCTPMGIVTGLMEAKKREFRPNPKALDSLREMGFKDEQIIEALRCNKNSKDAACEWILAGKTAQDSEDSTGLDQTSHLFAALVSAPTVRLGLNSPKTLLAFLNILESPASANTWLNDSDTAPVLSAIFKIYHAEKHAAPEGGIEA